MNKRIQSLLFEHILRRSLLFSLPALLAIAGCGAPGEFSDIDDDDESTAEATSPIVESTAGWGAYKPRKGDLCQAAENIQFYGNDFETHSYVVHENGYIRIDLNGDTLVDWTDGHKHGRSTRAFKYRRSNGKLRLKNCH